MIELLIIKLENVGLHINAERIKILHSNSEDDDADKDYTDVNGEFMQILHDDRFHRYLGRHLSSSFEMRSDIEFKPRKDQAWAAFHKHKKTLLNAHIYLRKRLICFDACITPVILFALSALPISKTKIKELDII